MVNEVLDLSRIEAGALTLSLESIEIGKLVGECIALTTPQADDRGVRFEFAGTMKKNWIRADRTRLRQVMVNLLSNAIKYNRRGGQIAVDIGGDSGGGSIAIRDTRRGPSAAQIEGMFPPVQRLWAGSSGIRGGGSGVVVVEQLFDGMEPRIGVSS